MNPASDLSFIMVFLAGIVSFLSPCVLPLVPGYISIITGSSFQELNDTTHDRIKISRILVPTLLFILGFSTVFVIMGLSSSAVGSLLAKYKTILLQVSGVIVIVFGLFTMEVIKINTLLKEKRLSMPVGNPGGIGKYLLGVAFGFGWTPCIGPILATILLYTSTTQNVGYGGALLFTFSLGIGLPFLLTGILFTKAMSAFNLVKRHYNLYKYAVGSLLIFVGLMMVSNKLFYINIYGQKVFDIFGINFWQSF